MLRHSRGWVQRVVDLLEKRRRHDKADELIFAAMGAAAPHSQEAADAVTDLVSEIRGAEDESTNHLTDPNAQTDWTSIHMAISQGFPMGFSRVHAESTPAQGDSDANAGQPVRVAADF